MCGLALHFYKLRGRKYNIDIFITWSSKNEIIYCNAYVAYNMWNVLHILCRHVSMNILVIIKEASQDIVFQNIMLCTIKKQNKKHVGTLFMSIDTFILHWRKIQFKGDISRLETYWIYNLRMFTPFGLNIK